MTITKHSLVKLRVLKPFSFFRYLDEIMELNSNLIGVQGVLINCVKQTGEFTKINYRGGNEKNIIHVAAELTKFLIDKSFLKDNEPIAKYTQELNEIVFFLALNTVFKKTQILDEYSHLINIIPQLSKCLLANICFALNLVKQYGYVIEHFPLENTEELLDQMIECLRKGKPTEHLHNATLLLKAVANKLAAVEISYKTEETIEDIVRVVNIILKNILSLSTEHAKNMSAKNIYHHMGLTLLNLFDLLLNVDENATSLKSFLECLLDTASSVIKCVTLNVFCTWAEENYEDQPLQTIIAGKAYLVVEKYQKNRPASELVSMLGSIARKPKTISELILEADVPTMVKKVNEKDDNQKLWFRALLNTPIFQNAKIVNCIDRWWQVCDESDVDRLLTVPLPTDSKERQVIVKCASNLTLEGLRRILTIYFHREKFIWKEDTQEKLIICFNQIHPGLSQDEQKNILLLMLQNARLFFRHFYITAFKNSSDLAQIFDLVQDIAKIDQIGLEVLMQVFDENLPNDQNITNYVKVFDTMLSCQYYSWDFIVSNIILRLMDKYRKEDTLEQFCCCLQILKHFDTLKCELSREMELLQYVLMCASENRFKSFLEFSSLKEEITRCCVEYIFKKSDVLKGAEEKRDLFSALGGNIDDPWTNYYKNLILNNRDMDLIDYLLPNFDLQRYKEGKADGDFTRLLKVLPRCVSIEWRILLKEMESKCEIPVILNALTDIMILLCDITETQEKNQGEAMNKLIVTLKFCLQNFGRFLELESKSRDEQILAINNVCRVLRHIPDPLKPTEGISLINVLPDEALRSLAQDKEFVARIVLINDKQLCKVLAQKVLGII